MRAYLFLRFQSGCKDHMEIWLPNCTLATILDKRTILNNGSTASINKCHFQILNVVALSCDPK